MRPWSPRISFSTLACPDWSWGDIARRAAEYGYAGVEVRLIERETDLLARPEFSDQNLSTSRTLFESHGVQICGLASSVRFDHADQSARDADLAIGKRYLELAHRLGAGFIRVFGDVLPAVEHAAARQAVIQHIARGLDALGEHSEHRGLGVDVLIETHGDFSDSHRLLEVLTKVQHPRVGIVWDTHHPWRFCNEPLDGTYARLKPWIRHTHWKDSSTGHQKEKTAAEREAAARALSVNRGHREADYELFGAGEFPAAMTLKLLVDDGYTGWFSLEWEKAWHPNLADPEVALPPFPGVLRGLLSS
ncbi:MAG: sugar phosphate isomerase/epimerase [Planctomycetes bacterium]|nr:sugar phosphate isomerase/epimerase [Planctomycetota bacterium]